ncbi:MAG: hypothetical protein WBX14_01495, partial [Candidatus Udaeobacter sp.]
AYSTYLIQKLAIHAVERFCSSHNIQSTSALAVIGVELCVYATGTFLFFLVERPFLQLRKRHAPRHSGNQLQPRRQEVALDKPHTS